MTMQALQSEYWEKIRNAEAHESYGRILPGLEVAFEIERFHLFVAIGSCMSYQKHSKMPVGVIGVVDVWHRSIDAC